MPAIEPIPDRILAVLLGAGWYAHAPMLAQRGPSFENSARDLRQYLLRPKGKGLGLPLENMSYLFDDGRSAVEQLCDLGDFLKRRTQELRAAGKQATDLILYYVGHGMFCGPDRAYHLAIRATEAAREGLTSIRVSDLAQTINDHGRFLRKFLILDACFAGAAHREFQSAGLQASVTQIFKEMPARGTALLCAASATEAAIAPEGLSRTMFSDSLLRALETGHAGLGSHMSLSELGALVRQYLQDAFPDNWVRPEIHCPDQKEGDVAVVELFPNPSSLPQADLERRVRQNEEDEAQAAEEARIVKEREERNAQEREAAAIRKAEEERKTDLVGLGLRPGKVLRAGVYGSAMVIIPPGRFWMGSPANEPGRYGDEGPVHEVVIASAFAVGKYPVTRADWRRFAEATACAHDAWLDPGFFQDDSHPVVNVSWHDAIEYLLWLSQEAGHRYRLLSEAEYEYCNRAGSTAAFWWGDNADDMQVHANGNPNRGDHIHPNTSPVGCFKANAFGLHDTTGNVWCWTQDAWHDNYHGAPSDGSAWSTGGTFRVVRGGAFHCIPRDLRAASRDRGAPDYTNNSWGFRIARSLF